MNNALNGIWRMGDRDECSVKHIGHATAALAMGRDWTDGLDYDTPWPTPVDPSPERIEAIQAQWKRLGERWAKVQAKRDAWGVDRFHEVMQATKFDWYHLSNLKFDWGYDEAKHDEAH